jgi:hypothetical protein
MKSPHLAQNLSAKAMLPRLTVGHQTFTRRQNLRPHPTPDRLQTPRLSVHPQARLAHPFDLPQNRSPLRIIPQINPEFLKRTFLHDLISLQKTFIRQYPNDAFLQL